VVAVVGERLLLGALGRHTQQHLSLLPVLRVVRSNSLANALCTCASNQRGRRGHNVCGKPVR
jgi:hypothetical protein